MDVLNRFHGFVNYLTGQTKVYQLKNVKIGQLDKLFSDTHILEKAHISHTFAVLTFIFNANFYQKDKVTMLFDTSFTVGLLQRFFPLYINPFFQATQHGKLSS